MEWIRMINKAIDYMENHLSDRITLCDIAGAVPISAFHFQRSFTVIAGMSPNEYLRRRRLSLAGEELMKGSCTVLEASLRYGYDSPESFSKAFTRFHGFSPFQVKNGSPIRCMNRFSVRITLVGGNIMEYTIEKREKTELTLFIRQYDAELSASAIPLIWKEYGENRKYQMLPSYLALCIQRKEDGEKCSYGIGCFSQDIKGVPEGLEKVSIPAHTWACFRCVGPAKTALSQMWSRIYQEWLPGANYELDPVYYDCYVEILPPGDSDSEDYVSHICIPVQAKKQTEENS